MLAPTAPSLHRRGLALGLSLALAAPAGVVMAPVTAHAAAMAPAEDAALAESRALYDEGKARFDTFDYEGAVDLWTKAYAKLPEDNAGVRNAMVYNIATAQEKAYDVDKDLQHLRQAVLLLQSYIKNYKAIYKRTPETEAEVQKAENRIAALQERIASLGNASVTAIEAVYVPADDFTDPAAAHIFSHLSASVVLSRKRASEGLYPAVDPLASSSVMLTPGVVGQRHYDIARGVRRTLAEFLGPILQEPVEVANLALFVEPEPGAPFIVHRMRAFGAAQERKSA